MLTRLFRFNITVFSVGFLSLMPNHLSTPRPSGIRAISDASRGQETNICRKTTPIQNYSREREIYLNPGNHRIPAVYGKEEKRITPCSSKVHIIAAHLNGSKRTSIGTQLSLSKVKKAILLSMSFNR